MSELPPVQNSPQPPVQYAAYPRGVGYDPETLRQAMDAYYGLSKVFLIHILLAVVNIAVSSVFPDFAAILSLAVYGATVVIISLLAYKEIVKITNAKGSSNGVAVALAVSTAMCLGIIGYVIAQSMALGVIKKFGVKVGFFGVKKKAILARIAELEAAQAPAHQP